MSGKFLFKKNIHGEKYLRRYITFNKRESSRLRKLSATAPCLKSTGKFQLLPLNSYISLFFAYKQNRSLQFNQQDNSADELMVCGET